MITLATVPIIVVSKALIDEKMKSAKDTLTAAKLHEPDIKSSRDYIAALTASLTRYDHLDELRQQQASEEKKRDILAEEAAAANYIKEEDIARLIKFRNNPSDESWMKGDK